MHDNQDGTYDLTYTLASEGRWALHAQVNGTSVRQHGFRVQASIGPVQPQDVRVSQQSADVHVCGGMCSVQIKVSVLNGVCITGYCERL